MGVRVLGIVLWVEKKLDDWIDFLVFGKWC